MAHNIFWCTLESMTASFGVDISGLKKSPSIWMDDATYKDASGTATFNAEETELLLSTITNWYSISKN